MISRDQTAKRRGRRVSGSGRGGRAAAARGAVLLAPGRLASAAARARRARTGSKEARPGRRGEAECARTAARTREEEAREEACQGRAHHRVPKKVHGLLGIPLKSHELDEDDS